MAFVDTDPRINLATAWPGLSIALDSLSAISMPALRCAATSRVSPKASISEGEFPASATTTTASITSASIWSTTSASSRSCPSTRARPTLCRCPTITSNVMYGRRPAPPDSRAKGAPFAPRCQPPCTDATGALPSPRFRLGGQAPLPRLAGRHLEHLLDLVTNRSAPLSRTAWTTLVTMLDGYFTKGAHHPERERTEPRDARGCHGTPGEYPQPDDPRIRATP